MILKQRAGVQKVDMQCPRPGNSKIAWKQVSSGNHRHSGHCGKSSVLGVEASACHTKDSRGKWEPCHAILIRILESFLEGSPEKPVISTCDIDQVRQ